VDTGVQASGTWSWQGASLFRNT